MRAKYLACICLTLLLLTVGCKKEPASETPDKPSPTTTAVQEITPEKTAPEKGVAVKAAPVIRAPEKTAPQPSTLGEKEYYAVFMEGKKVGHAVQSRLEADGQVTTSEDVSITMSRAGIAITITMTETSIETTEGKPLGFEVVQLMGAVAMKMKGTVDDKGVISLTTSSMGTEQKTTLEWPSGAIMAEGLRLLTLEKGMKEGTEYTVTVFSPGVMQGMDAKIRIGGKADVDLLGRVVSLTEVTTTMTMPGAGEIVSTGYVDEELRMQKSLVPVAGMQIEMVACAKEFALSKNDVLEIIDKMFLTTPERLRNPDSASQITYVLSPVGQADFSIPSTDNQLAEPLGDGKVQLIVKSSGVPAGGTFPYQGNDELLLGALKPNRFLQSDREEIINLARSAVGNTKDAGEAVRRIESFVAEYIENKDLSVGYASAVEVAKSKQGDCSEHAVLTAAMCRAVGIPAQMVTGIAYVDDWNGLRGFGGHAWVQAYVGEGAGKWVGLDAAFKGTGRGGHGPGHIALAVGNGEPADFLNLATTLGKFKIEKASTRK